MKKCIAVIMIILVVAGLVFSKGTQELADAEEKVKIGTIANVYGTASFNDDILDGINAAKDKYGLEELHYEVPDVSNANTALRTLIDQGCNLIVVGGADYKDSMIEVASDYPNVKFLYLADRLEGYSNIVGTEYAENQGAFLCGALAALLSKAGNVGTVAAVSGDTIQERYTWGFAAGAKYINKDIIVQQGFTNSYADVNKGNEFATAMYQKGADIVSCFAGACNLGVFNAAKSVGEGKYAFGAAKGQFDKMPEKIIASLVKPVDQTVLAIISDYVENGNFDTSSTMVLGVANEGVICKYTTENEKLRAMITEEIDKIIQDIRDDIISGNLVVPATQAEYNKFIATLSF